MAAPTRDRDARNDLTASSMTIPSDSESYSNNNDPSPSPPPSSSGSPMILYSPPTVWGLLRGAAINLLLPFVNGLMLGFGELLAHEAAYRLGWGGTKFSGKSRIRDVSQLQISNTVTSGTLWRSSRPHFSTKKALILGACSIRRYSGTPGTTSTIPPLPPPPTPDPLSSSTSELIKDEFSFDDLSNMPVHIGYLKTLGLDYGWGPTAIMEWLVEHVHVYAGTPWWLSISLAVIGIRFAVLKAYMAAADTSAKLQGVRTVTAPITEEMLKEQKAGNQVGVMQLRQKLKLVHQRAGIQTWKAFVPMTQVFIGFGTFRLMRGMSGLPVPGLDTGGVLWFQDLTLADPYMIMPVTTALMTVIVMKSANGGYALMAPAIQKALTYGLPVVTLVIMLPWPAALQLSFVISTIFSLAQSLLLRSVLFRRWAGITPMPPPPTPSSAAGDSPYMGSLNLGTSAKRVIGVSATSSPATPPKKAGGLGGIVDKAVSDMKGARDELTKQVQKYSGSSGGGNKKAAEAYEKRRSVEEAQRRRDEEQARRQRLLAKRAAKAKQSER